MADQLEASAALFGISVDFKPDALGDAHPFYEAGILEGSYMVHPDDAPYYLQIHRPEDDTEIIQLSWLKTVGTSSAHALFVWSSGE